MPHNSLGALAGMQIMQGHHGSDLMPVILRRGRISTDRAAAPAVKLIEQRVAAVGSRSEEARPGGVWSGIRGGASAGCSASGAPSLI